MKLTKAQKFIVEHKINRLIQSALDINPNSVVERIDYLTVSINGVLIECKNFNVN